MNLTLPWPPTVNTYWRQFNNRTLLSQAGRKYRENLIERAQVEKWGKVTTGARLSVQIDAWMPDRRRRDLDNILKATLDGLTHCGVWEDDSQIDHISIRRVPSLGGMLKVHIAEVV
jgi:crossover junction endodeoxyribonuclease RusA